MAALDAELYSDAMGRMHACAKERDPNADDKRKRWRPNFSATSKGLAADGKRAVHRLTLLRWWERQTDEEWERYQNAAGVALHEHDATAVAARGARLQLEGMFRVAMGKVSKAMEDDAQWDELSLLHKTEVLLKLGKAAEFARGLNPELVGAKVEGEDKGDPRERAGKVLRLWEGTQRRKAEEE